jgi:signal transduction histidine kinase
MSDESFERWRRPGPTPEQRRVDVLVGIAVALLAVLNLTLTSSFGVFALGHPPSWPERILWTVAVTVPLVARRRWPDTVALVVSAAFIAGQVRAAPETELASGALFCAIYTLGAWGPSHRRSVRIRLGIIGAMFTWMTVSFAIAIPRLPADAFADAAGPIPPLLAAVVNGVLINVLIFGFAYFFGETAWIAARREHQLEVQADQLRASQAEAGERAVMRERVRIARELHDVVAHHVSVMGVQASAGRRVLDKDPVKARAALAAVEQSARTAVDELRRMLSLLRRSDTVAVPAGSAEPNGSSRTDPALSTAAGIDRVEDLVASAREAGLDARVGVFGDPVPLPESLSQTAYRIVQEAITNTLKHAGATAIDIRIRYLATELELDVADDGRGPAGTTAGTTAGNPAGNMAGNMVGMGLIGMRERVAAHDGILETGPRAGGGGFRVRARFPLAQAMVQA